MIMETGCVGMSDASEDSWTHLLLGVARSLADGGATVRSCPRLNGMPQK